MINMLLYSILSSKPDVTFKSEITAINLSKLFNTYNQPQFTNVLLSYTVYIIVHDIHNVV